MSKAIKYGHGEMLNHEDQGNVLRYKNMAMANSNDHVKLTTEICGQRLAWLLCNCSSICCLTWGPLAAMTESSGG